MLLPLQGVLLFGALLPRVLPLAMCFCPFGRAALAFNTPSLFAFSGYGEDAIASFLLDENVLHYKQHRKYIERDVELLEVAANDIDGNIRDNTAQNTVRYAVC